MLIRQERKHPVPLQTLSALQGAQFDKKGCLDDVALQRLQQLQRRLHGAASGQDVIDHQHACPRHEGILVHFQGILAILQGVFDPQRGGGQFARFAHGDQAGVELIGQGSAENKAARFYAHYLVDVLAHVALGQEVDRQVKRLRIRQQGGNVLEDDPRLGEILDVTNLGGELLQHRRWPFLLRTAVGCHMAGAEHTLPPPGEQRCATLDAIAPLGRRPTTMAPLRLLACFAHPDDEAFCAAGVLAASAAHGVQVRLLCATCGEEGDIRQPGLATRETLGQVRYEELRRSCQALGVGELVMWGYRDSGWGDSPAQYHPAAFVQAPALDIIQRIVEDIRRFQPHTVLTFEPDGISGHKDHKAIHRYTTAAVHLAGDPAVFPAQGRAGLGPYTPQRLLYVARLAGHRQHRARLLRQAGLDVPIPDVNEPRPQGVPLDAVHLQLDVTAHLDRILASIRCHQTQIGPDWAFDRVPWETTVALLGQESLLQGHPTVQPGAPRATVLWP